MKAYSEVNLIEVESNKNLLTKLFTLPSVSIKLLLPPDTLFRAEMICKDVEKKHDERYKLDHLMQFLLEDIVDYVVDKQNVKHIHTLIASKDKSTLNVRLKHYQQNVEEEEPLYPILKKEKEVGTEQRVRVDRKDILRLEILLQDIATVFPNHSFTVERILEIMLIDFVTKYERGEAKAIIVT